MRERLLSDRFYYVETDGSDSYDGRTPDSPWKTLQHAWDFMSWGLDLAGKRVKVLAGDGTHDPLFARGHIEGSYGASRVSPASGAAVTFVGNLTTPANCVISATGSTGNSVYAIESSLKLEGFAFAAGFRGVVADDAKVDLGVAEFKQCDFAHMQAAGNRGVITCLSGYRISGSSQVHCLSELLAHIQVQNRAVWFEGSTNFSNAFCLVDQLALADWTGATFDGTAPTGRTYDVTSNGVLVLAGNTLPGSLSGVTGSGGQVI